MSTPFVQPIDKSLKLRKTTLDTPWGKVATDPGGSFLEPFHHPDPFRCPKCNILMEPGFFAEGRCISCGHMWKAKEAIEMLIEAETVRVAHGKWGREQLDALEDKRRLKESSIVTRTNTIEEVTSARRAVSEWYNMERQRLFGEFNRRAQHNRVTNELRSQSRNAGL